MKSPLEHKSRNLNVSQKRFVLDRDGWCCNKCGYVPFHTFADTPLSYRKSYQMFCDFMEELRHKPPVIHVRFDILPDTPNGELNLDVRYLHGGELEFDHIIPVYKGGSLELHNVQALCIKCHNTKSNLDYRYTESVKYAISKFAGVVV